jgi:hypothetical protein
LIQKEIPFPTFFIGETILKQVGLENMLLVRKQLLIILSLNLVVFAFHAKDKYDNEGGWGRLWVKILPNTPPDAPTIYGLSIGRCGREYRYFFVSFDPDEDNISYFVDWGDGTTTGWTREYLSGEMIGLAHTYSRMDSYVIRAKARDSYGDESNWSTLKVFMPRCKKFPILPIRNLPFEFYLNTAFGTKLFFHKKSSRI